MGFDLTPTAAQHDLARRAHQFAESVIRPVALDYDQRQDFPWPVLEEAATLGFYSPLFYRDLIGDSTGLSLPMFMEELFWGCAGIGLAIVMPALALSAIGQAATAEQMLQWAPECFGTPGDLKLAALAISEPEGGSDVRNLRTTARRDGDDWIIEGHKMWIGNGDIANVHVVNAVVDPDLGHRGQALFIVPGGSPGLELVRKLDKLGCRASHTAELWFDGVRIPADNLLGGQDKLDQKLAKAREILSGAASPGSATLSTFEQTRPMVAAQAIGIARAALEYATDYATRREAFGGPIIDNQGIAFPLAELATAIDAARLLTWRASWMAANGIAFNRGEGSMAKLAGTGHRACHSDPGRLGLHHRPSGREVVPRCQVVHHLRRHERDSADGDRAGAGRGGRHPAAARRDRAVRRSVEPDVRSRHTPAYPGRGRRTGDAGPHPRTGAAGSHESPASAEMTDQVVTPRPTASAETLVKRGSTR